MVELVTRDQWNAAPPKRDGYRPELPVRLLILHHEGGGADPPSTHAAGRSRVRAIQRWHLNHPTINYRDIAYTMLADDHARYEGRDWRTAPGATKGYNTVSKAVCATGDYTARQPSPQLLDNLARCAVDLWRNGAIDVPMYDGAHRDYGDTRCPGDRLYAQLDEINRRAARLAHPPKETPVDAVLLVHPSVGTPDALAGLAGVFARPDQKVGLVCNVDAAKAALAEGKRVWAIGGPAAKLVEGDRDLSGVGRLDTLSQVLDQAERGW